MAKTPTPKSWFTIHAAANGRAVPEILLYDEIGAWGVTATDFYHALKALGLKPGDAADLRINSPGGDCFMGNAIYNMLMDTGAKWTIYIDGIAASMASLVAALPGAEVIIAANAFIMIHNPAAWAMGESKDMKRTAELLDSIRDGMASAYVERSGLPEEEILAMMDAETWLDADEAVAKGFADKKGKEQRLAAKFDLKAAFPDIPENVVATLGKFKAGPVQPSPKPKESDMDKTELAAALAENNKDLATSIVAGLAAVLNPPKTEADKAKDEAKAYAAEVAGLCDLAGFPADAAGFIAKDTPVAEVRAALIAKKAANPGARGASVTARVNNTDSAAGAGGDEDISDLVPAPITPDAAFKNFHGKYHGRH